MGLERLSLGKRLMVIKIDAVLAKSWPVLPLLGIALLVQYLPQQVILQSHTCQKLTPPFLKSLSKI
jgi:hypothetical protein